ncbi:MAG: hypothetical protein IJM10_05675, partial [Clostridia bacterium]|nr:hypothetical protein [Clostridia bacterium]
NYNKEKQARGAVMETVINTKSAPVCEQLSARSNNGMSFYFFNAVRFFADCFYFYFINTRRSCIDN